MYLFVYWRGILGHLSMFYWLKIPLEGTLLFFVLRGVSEHLIAFYTLERDHRDHLSCYVHW